MIVAESNLFRVILADDAWPYNDNKGHRRDNPGKKTRLGIGVERRYSAGTMTPEEMIAMGPLLRAIATPDAYLFMWATMPRLDTAIQVMEGRGWRYIGVPWVWVKVHKGLWLKLTTGKCPDECLRDRELLGEWIQETLFRSLFRGPGRYVPSNVELVIHGVRDLSVVERRSLSPEARKRAGKPWHPNTGWKPQQVIITPHPRHPLTGKIIHSRKPEQVQDDIDRWLGPHLQGHGMMELFATRLRPGHRWTCLGHALTGTDIRDDLRDLEARAWSTGVLRDLGITGEERKVA